MRTLPVLSVLVLAVFLSCAETATAQAPTKNGLATQRERSYILIARRVYQEQLSVEEARLIAKAEDKAMAGAKDKTQKISLLGDYLEKRAAAAQAQRDKRAAEDQAKYLADAPARLKGQMQEMQGQMQQMQMYLQQQAAEANVPNFHQ